MGLLDIFDSEQGRLGLGLLAMAGPQARPMGFGERLMGAYGMVDQMRQQKRAQELDDIKKDLYRAQIGETNAQAEERKAKVAQEQRAQALLQAMPSLFRQSTTQGSVSTPDIGGVPMFSAGSKVEQPSMTGPTQFDAMAAARLGAPPDLIEKYAKLADLGRPEVARTVEVMRGGKPVTVQLDKFGNEVGGGLDKPVEMGMQDLGGNVVGYNKFTGQPTGVTMPKSMTPGDAASNSLARQRLAFDIQNASKPQFHDGQWVAQPSAANPSGMAVPVPGYNKPPSEGQKKQLIGIESVGNAVENYITALSENSGLSPSPTTRAKLGQAYNNLMLQAKEAYNLGVLNGPDYKILTTVLTDPLSFKGAVISNEELANQAKQFKSLMNNNARAVRSGGAGAGIVDFGSLK